MFRMQLYKLSTLFGDMSFAKFLFLVHEYQLKLERGNFILLRLQRRFKIILLMLLTLATLLCVWFSLSIYGYTSNSPINIFITLCLVYFFSLATTPIYLEAAVEATYPVPEGKSIIVK